jgi:hypothetical protein
MSPRIQSAAKLRPAESRRSASEDEGWSWWIRFENSLSPRRSNRIGRDRLGHPLVSYQSIEIEKYFSVEIMLRVFNELKITSPWLLRK